MDTRKLELIHVIFRHGERTPDELTFYRRENETNCNEYYPYGVAQLTNKGKKDMYELGSELRQRYKDFLGKTYLPKHVDAWSSEFDRTRTSLLVVLAGLYPPEGELIWNDKLRWQPPVTKYNPAQNDMVFLSSATLEYRKLYNDNFKRSPFARQLMNDYKGVLKYVEEHTGLEMFDTFQAFKLHDCLIRERMFNVHPKWATDSVLGELREIAFHEMNTMMIETPELKRHFAGSLLEKVVYDSKRKIEGSSTRKIHLYGGHDINITGILAVLELLHPHLPEEGSCVVVELYSTLEGYKIEVKYKSNITSSFETQPFPDGQSSCSFEKLEELLKKHGPDVPGVVPETKIKDRVFYNTPKPQ